MRDTVLQSLHNTSPQQESRKKCGGDIRKLSTNDQSQNPNSMVFKHFEVKKENDLVSYSEKSTIMPRSGRIAYGFQGDLLRDKLSTQDLSLRDYVELPVFDLKMGYIEEYEKGPGSPLSVGSRCGDS